MKYFALAALLGVASSIKVSRPHGRRLIGYAESEGPTMKDFGENDEDVLSRNGLATWGNPLYWKDSGDADDSVVL